MSMTPTMASIATNEAAMTRRARRWRASAHWIFLKNTLADRRRARHSPKAAGARRSLFHQLGRAGARRFVFLHDAQTTRHFGIGLDHAAHVAAKAVLIHLVVGFGVPQTA